MAVDLTGTFPGAFKAGPPQELFSGIANVSARNYEVLPGGKRFLVLSYGTQAAGIPPIVVVLNWLSGIKQ